MQAFDYDEVLDLILAKDDRYHRDAYYFVREGLDFTQQKLTKAAGAKDPRHVSGRELMDGMRRYALENYGPMTKTLLNEWGVNSTEDFGEIVFNLVENNLLAKTEEDSREDFGDGFDFDEAFIAPFQPAKPSAVQPAKSKTKRKP